MPWPLRDGLRNSLGPSGGDACGRPRWCEDTRLIGVDNTTFALEMIMKFGGSRAGQYTVPLKRTTINPKDQTVIESTVTWEGWGDDPDHAAHQAETNWPGFKADKPVKC